MKNCEKHSKLLCSKCRHYDYCDIAKRCDGVCYNCDITDCQNHKNQKTIKAEKEIVIMSQTTGECIHLSLNNYKNWNEIEPDLKKRLSNPTDIEEEKISIVEITGFKLSEKDGFCDKPKHCYQLLKESGIINDDRKYNIALKFCASTSFGFWLTFTALHKEYWDCMYRSDNIID